MKEEDKAKAEEADLVKADTNKGQSHEYNFYYGQDVTNKREGALGRRESNYDGPNRENNPTQCGYCDKFGHYEAKCQKKKSESTSLITH